MIEFFNGHPILTGLVVGFFVGYMGAIISLVIASRGEP